MELVTVVIPVTVFLAPTTKQPQALAICSEEYPARFAGTFKSRPPILPGNVLVAGVVALSVSLSVSLLISPLSLQVVSAVTMTTTSLAATKVIVGFIIVVTVMVVCAANAVVV